MRILSLFASLLLTGLAGAQTVTVLDERGDPAVAARATFLPGGTHTHADAEGRIAWAPQLEFDSVRVSLLGYAAATLNRAEAERAPTLRLRPAAYLMRTVSVRADEPLRTLGAIDLRVRPVDDAPALLRVVPGLFVGQHAGGGKAEQLFVRGFDVDHGTDLALSVEGMPVNLVSHAHGQGYADLHFVIPEAVRDIDYGKGPYDAERGNFATAGYVDVRLRDRLVQPFARVEAGVFGHRRAAGGLQLVDGEDHGLYVLAEALRADGPFESPQGLTRENAMARYVGRLGGKQQVTATATHFASAWDASGQIPARAVDAGLITRFGAIDDTEGGRTSRTNLLLGHRVELSPGVIVRTDAYAARADFELFSNFTFFLEDPVAGDQIRQRERRSLYGVTTELQRALGRTSAGLLRVGAGLRADRVRDLSLAATTNRTELRQTLAAGEVDEDNLFAYASTELPLGAWTITTGLRVDGFAFAYEDARTPAYEVERARAAVWSPKLTVAYRVGRDLGVYAKAGRGFHANDTRAIAAGDVAALLPWAFGLDLGASWKASPQTLLQAAAWGLDLEQEFVYVGDAGIVEPAGRTRRVGLDVSLRHEFAPGLFADVDYTFARARTRDAEAGERRVPLAPVHTLTGGLAYAAGPWTAGLRLRALGDRPATEDAALTAEGYAVVDANCSYRWRRFTLGLRVDNVLDAEWQEAAFATESRLRGEIAPVEEIHFTPGAPRRILGTVTVGL